MAGDLTISTINGQAIGVKNAIINGNFNINQRGVSGTVTLAAGAYGHDRFKAGASGCTYTFATAANITTLTISAGSLIQVVEGLNLQTDTYTLSWVGTAQGKIGAGSFAGAGVTGAVTGGTNLNLEFNTGTLSRVQLEKGSTATSFDYRPYGTELALCQRYYQRYTNASGAASNLFAMAQAYTTTDVIAPFIPTVSFRTVPTINGTGYATFNALGANGGGTSLTLGVGSSTNNLRVAIGGCSGLAAGNASGIQLAAGTSNYIDLSAEL